MLLCMCAYCTHIRIHVCVDAYRYIVCVCIYIYTINYTYNCKIMKDMYIMCIYIYVCVCVRVCACVCVCMYMHINTYNILHWIALHYIYITVNYCRWHDMPWWHGMHACMDACMHAHNTYAHVSLYWYTYVYIYRERERDTRRHLQCVRVPLLKTKSKAGPLLDRGPLPAQSFFKVAGSAVEAARFHRKFPAASCGAPYKTQRAPVWAAWSRLPHGGTYVKFEKDFWRSNKTWWIIMHFLCLLWMHFDAFGLT